MNRLRNDLWQALPLLLVCLTAAPGCVTRPETAPVTNGSTTQQYLFLQVTRDPADQSKGWINLANAPIPVKFEGGVWIYDPDPRRGAIIRQPASPPPTASPTPQPSPPIPAPVSQPTTMTLPQVREALIIERMELERALLMRMRTLVSGTSMTTLDELKVNMERIERILQELNRVQPNQP